MLRYHIRHGEPSYSETMPPRDGYHPKYRQLLFAVRVVPVVGGFSLEKVQSPKNGYKDKRTPLVGVYATEKLAEDAARRMTKPNDVPGDGD